VKAADAQVRTVGAELDRAKSEYDRAKRLYESGVIPERDLIAARTAFEGVSSKKDGFSEQKSLVVEGPRKEDIAQARAGLNQAKERYALVKEGPRKHTVEQARARAAQAESALALANTRLGYAELKSPMSGVVVSKNVEPGEYVSPGAPVITIGDLKNVFLRAYINETDLGRVKVGRTVCLSTDTYPGKKYEGRISFIAPEAEFTPKNVQTTKERVKLVYRIKVAVPNQDMELKPGMPADADILLKDKERCK
jgi:HlyD family secretion protein